MDLFSAVRNREEISHILINLIKRYNKLELAFSNYAAPVEDTIVEDTIVDGVTDKAPSQNAVYDALLTKASLSDVISMDNALQIQIDTKANIAGQIFTGDISAPNLSGTNTGDETTSSIQTKRPLKTIEGQSLEGVGDINLNKSDVGLSDVDNTSDLNKPISTATQTALNLKEDKVNKGIANGYAPLDGNNKVPLSYIDDALLGNVNYKGLWNQNTNTPTLSALAEAKGHYYICSGPTASTVFGLKFNTGDWIISNGVSWDKVDNTDSVSSVFGRTGNIVAQLGDYTTALVTEITNKNYQTDLQKLYNDATSSIQTQLDNKQATLVSGVNIRTINGNTLLGSTDLVIPIATDATTTTKGIVQLAGDLGGTANLPTTPTAIHKTGNELGLTGIKGWTNTGSTQINGLSFTNSGTGTSNSINVTNSNTGIGLLVSNTNSGKGIEIYNDLSGIGLKVNNNNTGTGITSNATAVATGLNYVGQNNGTNTFTVNKTGDVVANKYTKTGGLATQYLKADGSVSTLTNPVTGTGSNGKVAFWNGTNTQTGDNGLFWDNTNKRLGVGITDTSLGAVTINSTVANALALGDIITPASEVGILLRSITKANVNWSGGGRLAFNGNSGSSEKMTILDNGNVGLETTNPIEKLHVVGNILASGSITPSDRRLKSNIVPIINGLDSVMKMRPISYDKAWELGGEVMSSEYGFIAQELKEIFPDEQIVKTPKEEDDILNVNYTSLIAVLTKAIQEQQIQIDELKRKLENL